MSTVIRRGSTPDITIEAKGVDLTDWQVYVTLQHRKKKVDLDSSRLDVSYGEHSKTTYIAATLTQEETLLFPEYAEVDCQVHAVRGATRLESGVDTITVRGTLRDEIIP